MAAGNLGASRRAHVQCAWGWGQCPVLAASPQSTWIVVGICCRDGETCFVVKNCFIVLQSIDIAPVCFFGRAGSCPRCPNVRASRPCPCDGLLHLSMPRQWCQRRLIAVAYVTRSRPRPGTRTMRIAGRATFVLTDNIRACIRCLGAPWSLP